MNFTCLESTLVVVPHPNPAEPTRIAFCDTIGEEGYDRLRPLMYSQTDVFLVCFSVADRASFGSVWWKWVREVRHHCPDARLLLVGLKADLRGATDESEESDDDEIALEKGVARHQLRQMDTCVKREDGEALAQRIGAHRYVEVASPTCDSVADLRNQVGHLRAANVQDNSRLKSSHRSSTRHY